jgi:hypothetical protein
MTAGVTLDGYRSLESQRFVYWRLLIAGGDDNKSDLMVFNKLTTFNGLREIGGAPALPSFMNGAPCSRLDRDGDCRS